jgi:hypothetical protein
MPTDDERFAALMREAANAEWARKNASRLFREMWECGAALGIDPAELWQRWIDAVTRAAREREEGE